VVYPAEVVYVPLPLTGTVFVKIGEALHVWSLGPKSLKVMLPVGVLAPESVALSLSTVPIGTPIGMPVGFGAVTIVSTDTVLVPAALPVSWVVVSCRVSTLANCPVCNPAVKGRASCAGVALTFTVKSTWHEAASPPGVLGPRITFETGVNTYSLGFPVAATVKLIPAHAVPA